MVFFNTFKKIALIITVVSLTTACNEEAFYKQDNLEALNNPDINLPLDPPTTGPTDPIPPVDPTPVPDPQYQEVSEFFTQSAEEQKKVDILWVIDDSGSMGNEQDALARNFNVFINDFLTKGIDFRMAITTTDTSSDYKKGLSKASLANFLTSEAAAANESKFLNDFSDSIKVGTSGSGREKGLSASLAFMNRYDTEGYFREDAVLTIVYVSDEQDQSSDSVQAYIDGIATHKSSTGLVKIFSIIVEQNDSTSGTESYGSRYKIASNTVGGSVSSIKNDFHKTLSDMGSTISKLADSFSLAGTPSQIASVKVFVEGQETTTGWDYDTATRSVHFQSGYVPAAGLDIEIKYLVKK